MRARLVRPEFWTDSKVAKMSASVRLFYIGLWCVADDAGYIDWDLAQIAAELMPYQGAAARERLAHGAAETLIGAGRIEMLTCGRHARIPTLERHRIAGGTKSETLKRAHSQCQSGRVRTSPDKSRSDSLSDSDSLSPSSRARGEKTVVFDLDDYNDQVAKRQKQHLGIVG